MSTDNTSIWDKLKAISSIAVALGLAVGGMSTIIGFNFRLEAAETDIKSNHSLIMAQTCEVRDELKSMRGEVSDEFKIMRGDIKELLRRSK